MENQKKYWRGLEELNTSPEFAGNSKNEFMEGLPLDEALNENSSTFGLASNRRDFLKFFGFSIGAVALAACNKTPVKNAIPYVVKPENITPGVPLYYASTCGACAAGCGILVKTREGRPIKVDGNEHTFNKGATCAQGQASVLTLYDNDRIKSPLMGSQSLEWKKLDADVASQLKAIDGSKIRVVSGTINSPSTQRALNTFLKAHVGAEHITYDAISSSAIIKANEESFGKAVVPSYDFSKAEVIVSFGADFLGTWISPVEYTKQWVENRKLNKKKTMSRHIQFESHLSITGSSADMRLPIKPSQQGLALANLYNRLADLNGSSKIDVQQFELPLDAIKNTANELWAKRGAGLVVSGSNDVDVQILVNGINTMLGNYGKTIDLDNHSNQRKGVDSNFDKLVDDMNSGAVEGVVFYNVNPAYNYHNLAKLSSGIKKLKLSVGTSYNMDETAKMVKYTAPDHHYLESWNDHEAKVGHYTLTQPTITRIFNTRQAQESLLIWAGWENADFYTFIQDTWKENFGAENFVTFWNQTLHDGFSIKPLVEATAPSFKGTVKAEAIMSMAKAGAKDKLELMTYEKVSMGDGSQGTNPWLQELPDPISKVCWDNYAVINKSTADRLSLIDGDNVSVSASNHKIDSIPVLIQPGMVKDTIAIALGYGRIDANREALKKESTGKNAFAFRSSYNGHTNSMTADVKIAKVSSGYTLAQTQTHHTIEGRNMVKETTLDRWATDRQSGNKNAAHIVSLWDAKDYKGHRWAMAIDLNACTGCGSCVIACQAENNVAIVGREEVLKGREMHWMRIDRYYSFTDKDKKRNSKEKEIAKNVDDFENVSVAFQPVMCQHCTNATCETVCPVLATTHSSEGLNQMTYNRCIGTKYCANNCAFKVRRFNWFRYFENDKFDFNFNNDLGRMVINPDVTVRSRGVMEKCSFCVQRIQSGKLSAKRENRALVDGDVKTACQQACPANAIVFGDRNDPNSEISKLFYNDREYSLMTDDEKESSKEYFNTLKSSMNDAELSNVARSYALLEEINVKPSVKYQVKVRNRKDDTIKDILDLDIKLAKEAEIHHAREHAKQGHHSEHGAEGHGKEEKHGH